MHPRSVRHSMLDTTISALGFTLLTFLSGVLVARLLGPEGRGFYGVFVTVASFGFLFSHLSFYDAAIIEKKACQKTSEQILSTLLIFSFIVSFLSVTAMILLSVYKPTILYLGETPILFLMILFFVVDFFSKAFYTIESADLRFSTLNIDRVLAPFLFCFFCIVLWIRQDVALYEILLAYIVSKIPVLVKRIVYYRAILFRKPQKTFLIKAIKLGLTLHIAAILVYLTGQVDRLLLISIWEPGMLGQYFVALSAAGAGFAIISQAITTIALPVLVNLDNDRHEMVSQLIRMTLIASILISILVAVIIPFLVPIVYGAEFNPAAAYTRGLGIALVPLPALLLIQKIHKSAGRAAEIVKISLVVVAIFTLFFLLTHFTSPASLFFALGLSKLLGVLYGIRRLYQYKDIVSYTNIVPKTEDLRLIIRTLKNYTTSFKSQR